MCCTPDAPTAQAPVQLCCLNFKSLPITIAPLFWPELLLLPGGWLPLVRTVSRPLNTGLRPCGLSRLQHLHTCFARCPSSYPLICMRSRRSRFFICHLCHAPSILHAALKKQTVCPIAPSLRALFFTSSLPTICRLRMRLSHPSSPLVIPSGLRSASVPVAPRSPPPSPPSAFELSYLEGFLLSPLPLLTVCCSVPWMDVPLEVRGRCVENMKSDAEPDRICLSQSHRPSPALQAALAHLTLSLRSPLIVFTTAAVWWESSN